MFTNIGKAIVWLLTFGQKNMFTEDTTRKEVVTVLVKIPIRLSSSKVDKGLKEVLGKDGCKIVSHYRGVPVQELWGILYTTPGGWRATLDESVFDYQAALERLEDGGSWTVCLYRDDVENFSDFARTFTRNTPSTRIQDAMDLVYKKYRERENAKDAVNVSGVSCPECGNKHTGAYAVSNMDSDGDLECEDCSYWFNIMENYSDDENDTKVNFKRIA